MNYYRKRRRRYRSWSTGGYRPSKYQVLRHLFGNAVHEIKQAFLSLDDDALDELLEDYGAMYGLPAEQYARKTYPKWKQGKTGLSGHTMQRLVELVPPYLSPDLRYSILTKVVAQHKPSKATKYVRINVNDPQSGLDEIDAALQSFRKEADLAHVPEVVMKAAEWLYDHDMTAARAMLAAAEKRENDIVKAAAIREISLLRRTIASGQIKSANYDVEMPAGKLSIVAYEPSRCFVATACCGEDSFEVLALRQWRDDTLLHSRKGRDFIVWYYRHGERMSKFAAHSSLTALLSRWLVRGVVHVLNIRHKEVLHESR